MRAIHINAETKTIRVIENTGLESLQKAVGGLIETALHLPNGDTLFVNEEGLLMNLSVGFLIGERAYLGSGVIVGHADKRGDDTDAKSDLTDIDDRIEFIP